MTSPTNYGDAGAAQRAAAELRDAPSQLLDIAKTAHADDAAARAWEPERAQRSEYNEVRIRAERDQRKTAAGARTSAELDKIERSVNTAETAINAYTKGVHNRPDDAAATTRETRAWDRERPILDAGASPGQRIKDATDVDTLRALRTELPAWLTVKRITEQNRTGGEGVSGAMKRARPAARQTDADAEAMKNHGSDPRPLLDAVDRRLAELLPKAEGDRLRMALDTPALVEGVRERIKGMRSEFRSGVTGAHLRSALAARAIEREAQRAGTPQRTG